MVQKDIAEGLFLCIRNEVGAEKVGKREAGKVDLKELYRFALMHDLAHFVCHGALGAGKVCQEKGEKNAFKMAVFRCIQQDTMLHEIGNAFTRMEIPFLPLKGSVLRHYYPEPWMRTCGDIDILIHSADFERAKETLIEQFGLRIESAGKKDAQFYGPAGMHLELHFVLISDETVVALQPDMIWSRCTHEGFCYAMTDEDFYAYHLMHMRKHFLMGGCGIRTFLDLWVLNHRVEYDNSKRNAKLSECGIVDFANACIHLSEVWFGTEAYTPLTQAMEDYIIGAGVYGNADNEVQVRQAQNGSKFKSLIKRLWKPYDKLIWDYPKLEGRRYLQPYYEAKRFFKMIFGGQLGRSIQEVRANQNMSKQNREKLRSMLDQLGIS